MTTSSCICDLNDDTLALIFDAIANELPYNRAYNRLSALAFSETCKLLRFATAPMIFKKLVIWNWDSFCETFQMIRACENARRFTRTLQVTPIIERRLPPSDQNYLTTGLRRRQFDQALPQAGNRTNSKSHYEIGVPGFPRPETAYMPLASLEDGPSIIVDEQAVALADLLVSFDNLTGFIFGLGQGPSRRPPFEDSLISALRIAQQGAIILPTVTRLDIEDTAPFWIAICPSIQDLTLRLGYSEDGVELDSCLPVGSVRHVQVSGTAHCDQSIWETHPGLLGLKREKASGPALTKAFPNTTSLDLMDCQSNLEPLIHSLEGFTLLRHLHVHAILADLGLGLVRPRRRCVTGERTPGRRYGMKDEQRFAELERRKGESDRRNGEKQAALNLGKRLVASKFPQLQSFNIGRKISYDLTQLQSKEDLAELDGLMMATDVTLDEVS